jgi:tetratricopeptide (TPR) repeat protein
MNPVVEKMENIQALLDQIKTDISNGKSVEEVFQSLLPLLEKDLQIGGKLAELLIAIPDKMIGSLLHRMFDVTQDKKVRKTIKRSLFRLKSKGIVVEEILSDKERPVLRPFQADPKEGLASGIDFLGNRLLWLVIPHPGRGLTVMHGIVSDKEGIVDFSQDEMTRKGFRSFFKEVQEKNPFPFVNMEPSYVAFLFTQAFQLHLDKKINAPQEYLRAKGEIESIKKDYVKPLIYSHLPADEIAADDRILRKGGDLLKAGVFYSWRIEEDHIRLYADEVWEAEQSKIVLNQTQKEVRFQGIYQKALTELFSGERKFVYQRRLEEMAYVLLKLGRDEEAMISLSVAMDLEKPLNPIQPNPFLFQLVVKSIFTLLAEAYEKKSKEVSLIVKP